MWCSRFGYSSKTVDLRTRNNCRLEIPRLRKVETWEKIGRGCTMHDELNCWWGKVKVIKTILEEVPSDIVKSFLWIKFETNIILLIGLSNVLNNLLQYNNIVISTATSHKTSFVRTNNGCQEWEKTVNQDFGNTFFFI